VSQPKAGRRVLLVIVCLALFTDALLYSVAVPVLPRYSTSLGASSAAIGLLFGAYAIGLLLASPAAGAISDRVGRHGPMVVGSFGIALATVIFAFSESYGALLVARLVQGVSAAAVWAAGIALIADVFPPKRHGAAMGIAMASVSLGFIVGPPLGGLLAQGFGNRAPFLATAAVAALNGLVQLLIVPIRVQRRPRPSRMARLVAHPVGLITATTVVLGAGALSFLEPTLPLDLSGRLGLSAAAIGVAFGAATE
jgi:multidrug resistance protein